jgi:hypothetical protein
MKKPDLENLVTLSLLVYFLLLAINSFSFPIKGQIAFILAFVLFQLVFWSVALAEYFSE